jgi:hypothetical protein
MFPSDYREWSLGQGGVRHAFAFPRRVFARACGLVAPLLERGRRGAGVRAAPAISCACLRKNIAHEHTGQRRTLRHPLRNGVTAYFVLFPVERACCHRQPAAHCCRPDASLRGARTTRLDRTQRKHSPLDRRVHRIPRPTCRDDGDTPLMWARDGDGYSSDFRKCKAKSFAYRMDDPNQVEIAEEIRF